MKTPSAPIYLKESDKLALVIAYKNFLFAGANVEAYKTEHEYKAIDHLMALELGAIFNLQYPVSVEELEALLEKAEQQEQLAAAKTVYRVAYNGQNQLFSNVKAAWTLCESHTMLCPFVTYNGLQRYLRENDSAIVGNGLMIFKEKVEAKP